MTKAELAERVRHQFSLGDQGEGLTYEAAKHAVESIFSYMKIALSQHEEIVIRRFGRFKLQFKKERVGFNPKTGAHHKVSARTVVKFSPGETLRKVVNNGMG